MLCILGLKTWYEIGGFQIVAIIILLVFYGGYYAKMISQRKKGIQTDQMGKGKTGFVK